MRESYRWPAHVFVYVFVALWLAACKGPEKQRVARAGNPSPPTGTYMADLPHGSFTVSLAKSGDYSAVMELRGRTRTQRGKWTWDEARQEFHLAPDAAGPPFGYEFRKLRRDDRKPQTLQWIPLSGIGGGPGAVDYIRFYREKN